jgi:3-methyladenine DNA glycosylase AlkC
MTTKRKGAKSIKDIPKDIFDQLNKGHIETANLVEWLAIDQRLLLSATLTDLGRPQYFLPILSKIDGLKKQTVNTVNEAIGTGLLELATQDKDTEVLKSLGTHPSDAVRCWATYTIGNNPLLTVAQKLEQIQPFAADHHFGVREIAWISVRTTIAQNLTESIQILTLFTASEDENTRRFASESTRPRGVWCAHIESLKQDPEQALSILSPLKSDPSKYVQDSVANWLNDASKTKPQFVLDLCQQWSNESDTKETKYIAQRALRSINKS